MKHLTRMAQDVTLNNPADLLPHSKTKTSCGMAPLAFHFES